MSKMRFEINFLDLLNLILFLVEEIERKKKRFFNFCLKIMSSTHLMSLNHKIKRRKCEERESGKAA